jgi:hypothetical protein
MQWALRVAMQPPPLSDARVDAELERLREYVPNLVRGQLPQPAPLAAVTTVAVDGHGHVYVFPLARESAPGSLPVDVYSPAGERVFAGLIGGEGWAAAHEDYVFRIEISPETAERRIVRYRLVEPFD